MIPVRQEVISFVLPQYAFPHIGMFSFSHIECINLQLKAVFEIKYT